MSWMSGFLVPPFILQIRNLKLNVVNRLAFGYKAACETVRTEELLCLEVECLTSVPLSFF